MEETGGNVDEFSNKLTDGFDIKSGDSVFFFVSNKKLLSVFVTGEVDFSTVTGANFAGGLNIINLKKNILNFIITFL